MKDFRGVELAVGDLVAVLPPGYRNMMRGRIVKFTAVQATVKYGGELTSRGSDYIAFLERATAPVKEPEIPLWFTERIKREKALNKRELSPNIRDSQYAYFSASKLPCEVTSGQFCGGVQDVSYRLDGLVYTFTFQNGILFDAYTENDLTLKGNENAST